MARSCSACVLSLLPQDRVPAFSNKEAFAVVESELGVPFEDVYELVEPETIAAASIGQARDLLLVAARAVLTFDNREYFYTLV